MERLHRDWLSFLLTGLGLAGLCLFVFSDAGSAGQFWAQKGRFDYMGLAVGLALLAAGIYSLAKPVHWDAILPERTGTLAALFAVSLAVRLMVAIPVVVAKSPPIFDESTYLEMSHAANNIVETLQVGESPRQQDYDQLYHLGRFPPLQPIVFGLQIALFPIGDELGTLRIMVTLFSALTTPLLFLLTRYVSTQRGAIFAALVHAVYPTFVAFAHYLWSESLFMLFVVLTLLLMFEVIDAQTRRRRVVLTLLCGATLGLAGLTRAAVLPFLFLVPAGLFLLLKESWGQRLISAALALLVAIAVIIPWEWVQYQFQGQFVLLATTSDYNLYMGNNPWVAPGDSSTDGFTYEKVVNQQASAYAEQRGLSLNEARREIALREIRHRPFVFVQRVLLRAAQLWNVDTFIMRHILRAAYPPLPQWAPFATLGFLSLALLTFTFLAVAGFVVEPRFRYRWLWLVLLLANIGIPLISEAFTRLAFPVLVLLTPLVGHAIAHLKSLSGKWVWLPVLAVLATLVCMGVGLPEAFSKMPVSTYYQPFLRQAESTLDRELRSVDVIEFQTHSDEPQVLELESLATDFQFVDTENVATTVAFDGGEQIEEVRLHALDSSASIQLRVQLSPADEAVVIAPVNAAAWNTWTPLGVGDLEYRWRSGFFSFPESAYQLPESVRNAVVPGN